MDRTLAANRDLVGAQTPVGEESSSSQRTPWWRRRSSLSTGALAVIAALALLAGVVSAMSSSKKDPRPAASLTPPPPFSLAFTPNDGASGVPLNAKIGLTTNGPIQTVAVTDGRGKALPGGALAPDGRSWMSTEVLAPATRYSVRVTATAPNGEAVEQTSAFTTTAAKVLTADILPLNREQVGVGMPIVVRFNALVADRIAVQRALDVRMSTPVGGAWHWIGPREVHFRPKQYWPSGEQVVLMANLAGVQAGPGLWGTSNRVVQFRVGPAHTTVVDLVAHNLVARSDGQVVRTMPQSGGRPKYPTINGVHFVWAKEYDVLMDSATVGIPRESPDGYYQHTFWNVAISTSGEYIHAAPWSVGAQGRENVTHGCINLSDANAQWFYNFSQRGDIVEVTGSPRPPSAADGVADWNMPWDQWVAGDAVATAPPPPPATSRAL